MFKWICLLVGLVLSAAIVFHGLADRYYYVGTEGSWGVFDKLTGDYTYMMRRIENRKTIKVNPIYDVYKVKVID